MHLGARVCVGKGIGENKNEEGNIARGSWRVCWGYYSGIPKKPRKTTDRSLNFPLFSD